MTAQAGGPGCARVWQEGKALQDWVELRTLQLTGHWNAGEGEVRLVELCQSFYATAALGGTDFFRQLAPPCGAVVYQDPEGVKLNLVNPRMIFPVFFGDAAGRICADPTNIQCQMFTLFPSVVYNDLASIIDGVLQQTGHTGAGLPLAPLP